MQPRAYVVHRTRHRVRLRVPDKRADTAWFSEAAARLEEMDWVSRIETGPVSASLVLHCDIADNLDERLSTTGVFEFQAQAPAVPPATEQLKAGVSDLDRALRESGAGDTNLRSLLFLLMLILAGVQMARGQVMVPAISLLWYAMELVLGARAQPPVEIDQRRDESA